LVGLHFGRLFRKLVWSPCPQVGWLFRCRFDNKFFSSKLFDGKFFFSLKPRKKKFWDFLTQNWPQWSAECQQVLWRKVCKNGNIKVTSYPNKKCQKSQFFFKSVGTAYHNVENGNNDSQSLHFYSSAQWVTKGRWRKLVLLAWRCLGNY
jgi:hypothetical protein